MTTPSTASRIPHPSPFTPTPSPLTSIDCHSCPAGCDPAARGIKRAGAIAQWVAIRKAGGGTRSTYMGSVDADAFAVRKHAHEVPVHLRVAERRPTVRLGLLDELSKRAVARAVEQRLTGVRIVKGDLSRCVRLLLQEARRALPVTRVPVGVRMIPLPFSSGVEVFCRPKGSELVRYSA